jgi:ion channel
MTRLAERKYLLLILVLIALTIRESFTTRQLLLSIIFVNIVVLAVMLVVFERRRERQVALVAAAAIIATEGVHYVGLDELRLWDAVAYHALLILFLGFAVAVILRNIFEKQTVTSDAVLGAVCGYLLAGFAWGNVYNLTEQLLPGSFSVVPALAHQVTTWEGSSALFQYFSAVTLTTMGYGDVTPAHPPATAFATLEAVFGQFYIAVVVAQLVGLRLARLVVPEDKE